MTSNIILTFFNNVPMLSNTAAATLATTLNEYKQDKIEGHDEVFHLPLIFSQKKFTKILYP